MKLDELTRKQCAWLRENNNDSDVVISTRARLARNLSDFPFVGRASDADLESVERRVKSTLPSLFPENDVALVDFSALSREDALFLQERQLVSRDFVEALRPRAALIQRDENFSVMINEEDHLRLQATSGGFALGDVWKIVDELDDKFDSALDYAFDTKFGYLSACPSNVGTGLRASVMVHIPGLIETGETPRVLRSLQKLNFAVRGLYGEGSSHLGEFYQISNQSTIGASEEIIIEQLREVVACVVTYERRARQTILEKNREGALDRCFRALGLLSSARSMSMEEAMTHLSSVRLGVRLDLLDGVPISLVDDLLLHIQPRHLRKLAEELGVVENDEEILRANYLRKKLVEHM